MNRENKRKQYEKGFYKTHACDESFTCKNCGRLVVPMGAGTDHRNHCPNCLHSVHVDIEPGDRASDCGGVMDPAFAEPDAKRGFIISHKCRKCGEIRRNKAAADDDRDLLIELTSRH